MEDPRISELQRSLAELQRGASAGDAVEFSLPSASAASSAASPVVHAPGATSKQDGTCGGAEEGPASREAADPTSLILVAGELGVLLNEAGRFAEAEVALRLALLTAQGRGLFEYAAAAMNGLGVALCGQRRYAEAEFFLREALAAALDAGHEENIRYSASTLRETLTAMGNDASAKEVQKRVDEILGGGDSA